jgi:uncharacterized repeat protein (TIGR02543 family)
METIILAKRYELLEKIRVEEVANVYKALDRQLGRFVTVKILKQEFSDNQFVTYNFINEANEANEANGENKANEVFDSGNDSGIYYSVTGYAGEESLPGAKDKAGQAAKDVYDEPEIKTGGVMTQKMKMILIIAIAAAAVVVVLLLTGVIGGSGSVKIPDVVGMYEQDASDAITGLGLAVETEYTVGGTIITIDEAETMSEAEALEWHVIEQHPAAGTMVQRGSIVSLKLAPAEEGVGVPAEVPDIIGMTLEDAEYAIEEAGFRVGTVNYEDSDEPEDIVIAQAPKAGDIALTGSLIHLTVSIGEGKEIILPNLIGKTEEDAIKILESLKLQPFVEKIFNKDVKTGYVFDQKPPADTVLTEMKVVSLSVSQGPVPDLLGMTEAQARAALEAVGLRFSNGGNRPTTDVNSNGRVVEQSQAAIVRPGDTVTCFFGEMSFTVTASAGTGGTVSGGGTFAAGASVTVRATPNTGYQFVNWTGSAGLGSNNANYSFIMPSSNVQLTANFTPIAQTYFTVNVQTRNAPPGTTISASPQSCPAGTLVTVTAGPDNPADWDNSGGITDFTVNPGKWTVTFTMPAHDVIITALFPGS